MLHNFILNGSIFGSGIKKYSEGGGIGDFKIQLDNWNCDVHEDSYEDGEGERVNSFSEEVNKVFNSPKEFFDYLHNKVFYTDLKNEHYNAFEDGRIITSFLVDEDNSPASESEIAAWKKGQKKLYSANYDIYVSLVDKKKPTIDELAKILDIPQYSEGGGVGGVGKIKYLKNKTEKGEDVYGANVTYKEESVYIPIGTWGKDEIKQKAEKVLSQLKSGTYKSGIRLGKGGGLKQKGKTDKKHDKDYKAKRVGYRYTDEFAKKHGLKPNAKPTQAHIDKHLGNGVYFEDRANRSDKSRMKKLKRGGNAGNKSMMQRIQDEVKRLKAEAPNMFKKHTDFVKKAAANLKAKGQL